MSDAYVISQITGGDTAVPLTMEKRLRVLERYLASASPSGRFLDCGCGSGSYVLAIHERFGLDAHGMDYMADKITAGRAKPGLADRITQGDLQAIPLPSATWDYAMLNEVMEHLPDDRKALGEIHRILKPGGLLFVFSPNRWFPFETHSVRFKSSGRLVPNWVPFVPYIPLRLGMKFLRYSARNYWQGELEGKLAHAGFHFLERSFVWLTFEGGSGQLPPVLKALRPILRGVSNTLEKTPLLRRFGLSQVFVCRK